MGICIALFFINACFGETEQAAADSAKPVASETTKAHVPIDQTTAEQFMEAALSGDTNTISRAIMQGFDPNYADPDGRTALMLAGFNGHTKTALQLLNAGAKINHQDSTDRTVLMYTCTGPNKELAAILIEKGAGVNMVDSHEHWTPLMFAAAEGLTDIVTLLLDNGADRSMADVDGETAAYFAKQRGFPELAAFLEVE